MQALKAITRSLGLLFLIGVLFGIVLIANTVLVSPKQSQLDYIPAEAEMVVRINSRALIEQTLQSVFIDSEDEKLINNLFRKIKQRSKNGKKIENDGIDYLSDIVLFKMPFKTAYVIGVLVKLHDKDAFEESMAINVSPHRVALTHNDVGLILNYRGKENNHAAAIDLEQLADNVLSNSIKKQKAPVSGEALIVLSSKLGRLELKIVENSFVMNGSFSKDQAMNQVVNAHLKENGFFIAGYNLSEISSDFTENAVEYINFNFLGFGPAKSDGIPSVKLELLLGFKTKTDFISLVKEKIGTSVLVNEDKRLITAMNQPYHYKILNDSTFYIGSIQNPEFKTSKPSSLFKINGDPATFFNYKAKGVAMTFIEMLPLFHATKQMALMTESIDIKMTHKKEKQLILEGKIKFKKGAYPLHEIVRFLVAGNFIL